MSYSRRAVVPLCLLCCSVFSPEKAAACSLTGAGYIDDGDGIDSFAGNGMPQQDLEIAGSWRHQDEATSRVFHAEVTYVVCHLDQVYLGGPASAFDPANGWQDGYWIDVLVEERGEARLDEYSFTARLLDEDGQPMSIVYQTGGVITGGDIEIRPPNPGHPDVVSTLPPWVALQP